MKLSRFKKTPAKKPAAKKSSTKKEAAKKPVSEAPKAKPLRIIALDPSLTATGIVILDEKGEILDNDTYKTTGKECDGLIGKIGRFNRIVKEVSRYVQDCMNNNLEFRICREDYAYAASSSSDTVLKELGGVLEWELSKFPSAWSDTIWVPIATIKKFATGKGNSQKAVMMKEVYKNFGHDLNEHEADAFACGAVVLEKLRPNTFKLSAAQQAAVYKLDIDKLKGRMEPNS